MDKIDSVLIYGVALLVFAIFSLQFDVIYPSWGESLGLVAILVCTGSVIAKLGYE